MRTQMLVPSLSINLVYVGLGITAEITGHMTILERNLLGSIAQKNAELVDSRYATEKASHFEKMN